MKNITKKQVKESTNYIAMIDWRNSMHLSYMPLSNSLIESLEMADEMMDDKVYLIKILEKTNDVDKEIGIIYNAVMCNRHNGWHVNNAVHSESECKVAFNPNWSCYQYTIC